MAEYKVYHTVEDRGDPDYIEDNAPFKSKSSGCWVGEGYYFWERYVENAHHWGKVHYCNNYVICGSVVSIEDSKCFDILGNMDHLDYLEQLRKRIKEILKSPTSSLENIIKYAEKYGLFPYTLIRMSELNKYRYGQNSNTSNLITLKAGDNPSYLSLKPKIVLFTRNISSIEVSDFKIEYPDSYVSGYLG